MTIFFFWWKYCWPSSFIFHQKNLGSVLTFWRFRLKTRSIYGSLFSSILFAEAWRLFSPQIHFPSFYRCPPLCNDFPLPAFWEFSCASPKRVKFFPFLNTVTLILMMKIMLLYRYCSLLRVALWVMKVSWLESLLLVGFWEFFYLFIDIFI